MARDWIEELTLGYSLDGGGYTFEPFEKIEGTAVWDDPDWDYFPFPVDRVGSWQALQELDGPILVFRPVFGFGTYTPRWPKELPTDWTGMRLVLKGAGSVYASERECWCINQKDRDLNACPRCDEEGYVHSPGGDWAVYAHEPLPDLKLLALLAEEE